DRAGQVDRLAEPADRHSGDIDRAGTVEPVDERADSAAPGGDLYAHGLASVEATPVAAHAGQAPLALTGDRAPFAARVPARTEVDRPRRAGAALLLCGQRRPRGNVAILATDREREATGSIARDLAQHEHACGRREPVRERARHRVRSGQRDLRATRARAG